MVKSGCPSRISYFPTTPACAAWRSACGIIGMGHWDGLSISVPVDGNGVLVWKRRRTDRSGLRRGEKHGGRAEDLVGGSSESSRWVGSRRRGRGKVAAGSAWVHGRVGGLGARRYTLARSMITFVLVHGAWAGGRVEEDHSLAASGWARRPGQDLVRSHTPGGSRVGWLRLPARAPGATWRWSSDAGWAASGGSSLLASGGDPPRTGGAAWCW